MIAFRVLITGRSSPDRVDQYHQTCEMKHTENDKQRDHKGLKPSQRTPSATRKTNTQFYPQTRTKKPLAPQVSSRRDEREESEDHLDAGRP